MMEMTFPEHSERPECPNYGDHPRIRRKIGKGY